MSNISISLFKPGRTGKPGLKPYPTDFYSEMTKIKDGTHYPVIKELREIKDDLEKRAFKAAKLEAFTISAHVDGKREIKNATPSGLLAIDLDPKGNPTITDWGAVRDLIFEMPEVVAAFLSASGQGVAYVVKINPAKFKDVFYSIKDELSDNFDLNIDPGCHDIIRLRFTSCDPELKMRTDFDAIPIKEPSSLYLEQKASKERKVIEYSGEITSADCDRAFSYAEKSAIQRVGMFGDGHKHSYLVSLAGFCNVIGMSQGYLESEVVKRYGPLTDITVDRLLKPIQNVYNAYKHKHNTFKQTVQNRRLTNKIVGEVVNNYVRKGEKPSAEAMDQIAQKLEANIDHVEQVVNRVVHEYSEEFNIEAKQENASFKTFWYVDDDEKVNISKMAFRDFLMQKGIYRFEIGKDWVLIQIIDNIVEEIQKAHLKKIVFNHIENMKEYEVWEVLANRVHSVFSDDYLEIIPAKQIDFFRDGEKDINLFFLNGVVTISESSIDFTVWPDFKGYVWKNKVIERNIFLEPQFKQPIKSDFQTFLHNITKNDNARFRSITTSIGYLLHGYKDKSNVPAVILNDEVISDEPAGGTGKGIIADCLKQFKNVVPIDGRLWDVKDRFRFQDVSVDTDIVFFDDCEKNFPFEKLFSIMTEGIQIETKGGLKFRIPFKESPKYLLSTNYAIVGSGNSNDRRKNELEIAQYYSKVFTPKHEFKKLLFDGFNTEEYNIFDNFIFRCCALYMQLGLVEQELINQPLKQLYASTDKDFVDYMDEEYSVTASAPYKIDQAEAYAKYQKLYPSKLGSKTFYKYMERYFKYHKVEAVRHKSGDVRYFYIGGVF
jgi:hypothetical protein